MKRKRQGKRGRCFICGRLRICRRRTVTTIYGLDTIFKSRQMLCKECANECR